MLFQILEHESLNVRHEADPSNATISHAQARALKKLEKDLPRGAFSWGHNSVKFSQFCGVIGLGKATIEILPKIHGLEEEPGAARTALVHMLYQAKLLKPVATGPADLALQKHSLLDIFVLHFCDLLRTEMLQGLIRTYVQHEENLTVLKGKLRTELHLRHNLHRPDRLYCQFDEHSDDNPFNQLIKYSLEVLLNFSLGNVARQQVEELSQRMAHVSRRRFSTREAEAMELDRLGQRYQPILEQSRRIVSGYHPDIMAGDANSLSLLFDMNRLFEAHVGFQMRKWAWQQGLKIRLQGPRRYLAQRLDSGAKIFMMKPDMSCLDEDNQIVFIADAKWKLLNSKERKLGINQADLYQMLSYASAYHCDQLFLIYPTRV